jgi:hypothetical protein
MMSTSKPSVQANNTAKINKSKLPQPFSFSTEFLDLAIIDKMITLGSEFPQLPIPELQRIAREVWDPST